MVYLWSILLIVLNTVWLSLNAFGLPGNWLILMSTCAFAWWRWDDGVFSIYTLIVIALLAIAGELVEFFAGMTGARRAGASWRGSVGALIGAVVGAMIGTLVTPVVGTVFGACVGAGVGAWGLELTTGKHMKESFRHGLGAGVGEFIGITSKLILGVLIWLIVAVAAFWP
jgi:uncharacterized protein YqgC (DUF456 family)